MTHWDDEPELDLFGDTHTKAVRYTPPTDELGRRMVRVMWDERWRTLAELAEEIGGYGEATISARLRRFPVENGLDYTKRPIGDGAKWEYRLVLPW